MAAPNGNPYSDELNNRLEYAFARDPHAPDTAPVSGSVQPFPAAAPPGDYLTITFIRRTDTSDLTFTPQFSTDLTAWTAATVLVSSTPNPEGTVTETWRVAAPVATARRLCVRVRIE